jgi:succinate dehydrogenase / fumarate reductase cytochrome b subunit
MIGPHYKPQLTSLMSISHRASGVFLSIVGAPLLLWWVIALASGADAYAAFTGFVGGWVGTVALLVAVVSLSYHLLNGIRHLVWDSGHALDLRSAYTGGWLVLIGTVILAAVLLGAWL